MMVIGIFEVKKMDLVNTMYGGLVDWGHVQDEVIALKFSVRYYHE